MKGFPDVERALMEILSPLGQTGTAADEDLTIPIRVNRTGGPTRPWEDQATVEVTCFAENRPDAIALNHQVTLALNDLRSVSTAVGFIDKISSVVAPMPVFDLNPDFRKVVSTWNVISRLQDLPAQS